MTLRHPPASEVRLMLLGATPASGIIPAEPVPASRRGDLESSAKIFGPGQVPDRGRTRASNGNLGNKTSDFVH